MPCTWQRGRTRLTLLPGPLLGQRSPAGSGLIHCLLDTGLSSSSGTSRLSSPWESPTLARPLSAVNPAGVSGWEIMCSGIDHRLLSSHGCPPCEAIGAPGRTRAGSITR